MKHATAAVALLLASVSIAAHPAFAQLPGEAKPARQYDPVGDMQYDFQRWAPNEKVREVQQALWDKGYYDGPLDGVLNPAFRRAIWNFQRDKGLPRTATLDNATMVALDLPATGAASPGAMAPGSPSSFGGFPESSNRSEFQAP
jgi:peptidoglycan hydrolase-like protein with peptidoglycan-binding domain